MIRLVTMAIAIGLCGCGPMQPGADRFDEAAAGPSTALRRADNDCLPSGALDGTAEPIPSAVRARLRSVTPPLPPGAPACVQALSSRRSLYAVAHDGAHGPELLLVVHDADGDRVSPTAAYVSLRRSAGDTAAPAFRAPFARFDAAGGELFVQGTWAVGGATTSVVTRVFRLDDELRLTRVADFLTGDHFVWLKNPAGVWVVGDIHRLDHDHLRLDYVCHPLGRPDETRPIGQVAFRYSVPDGGYVEDGARIVDVHFSDFLRLDAR